MKVTILGAGAYALSLALRINKNNNITIWSKVEKEINELKKSKTNKKALPDEKMPDSFFYTTDLKLAVKNANIIIVAVSTKYLRSVCDELKNYINKNVHVVIASKGIEDETCLFASKIVKEILKTNKLCTISGPSFAKDMARNEIIGLSLAATHNTTKQIAEKLFSCNNLIITYTRDFVGVELCGTMKNIIALASGILDGLKVSESTKALFLTVCLNDIRILIKKLGGSEKTILSFAGFGDITLTCTSLSSRNYSYGKLIGQKKSKKVLEDYLKNNTVEGVYALQAIYKLIKTRRIKYPFLELLYNVINGMINPTEIIAYFNLKK